MKKLILIVCITTLALAGCSSKTSKAEVKNTFREAIEKDADGEDVSDQIDLMECVVDKSYSKVSAKSWKKLIDADPSESELGDILTDKEVEAFTKAYTECE